MRLVTVELRRPLARRLLGSVALASYLLATVGIPLPTLRVKDRTHPFPCQDHACGCANAEDCFHHCCCFSHEERLAWARANRVESPSAIAASPTGGWHAVRSRDQETNCPGCCTHEKNAATESEPCTKPCCARGAEDARRPETTEVAGAAPGRGIRFAPSFSALGCRGLSHAVLKADNAIPLRLACSWNAYLRPIDRLSPRHAYAAGTSFAPPIPPPRPSQL